MRTVVDLFAGCGGMSLGLEQAGYTPVFVSELHPDARESYLQNRPDLPVARSMNQTGDILELTRNRAELEALASRLNTEHGDLDLVVGGPPCQGFSGIGHRRTFSDLEKIDIPSNHLYREMAKAVEALAPRAFVFENVRGLLSSKWTANGEPGEIWRAVQAAFGAIRTRGGLQYLLKPRLLFASDYGVPQNRPRIILIGVRSDIAVPDEDALHPQKVVAAPDPVDLLNDLVDDAYVPGGVTHRYPAEASTEAQRWMRTSRDGATVAAKGDPVTDHVYSRHSEVVRARFRAIIETGTVPEDLKTKKFNQRLIPERWGAPGPRITVASLPDDYVHYSQPRACTVREWARLQTFPDWYQFAGKRTTGGRNRAGNPTADIWIRELPKFTQIGNAVPVRLAEAIGNRLVEVGITKE